ncbi:MAG: membrane protein insertion efficiency factor YidD [Holosporales bacterium]|jgi:putative membrane protein insertion efficiency factor|nr:membrane protein insertion efficiency factor YidD [Holosporales bacterium]
MKYPRKYESNVLVGLIKAIIRGYQLLLSPIIGRQCRFTPSCSEYAIIALEKYGLVRGIWMSIKRLLKCNPWSGGEV